MSVAPLDWHAWFPPALDEETARAIAGRYWRRNPHLAAALAWEAYAATLDPSPVVATVTTGSQSVSYSPPTATGEFGLALARAEWHRSFLGSAGSVPLRVPEVGPRALRVPYWELVDDDGLFAEHEEVAELSLGFPYPFIDKVHRA